MTPLPSPVLPAEPIHLVTLKRSQPDRNLHRFYALAVVAGLFAEWGVLREWGRIGSPGRVRIDWYATQAEAEQQCARLRRRKERKGYRVVGEGTACPQPRFLDASPLAIPALAAR